jgi:hypothetical protein
MNAGSFGGGRDATSLLSIEITVAIVGLSTADSCTHKSPICMHLKIFLWWLWPYISGSMNDKTLSSFHWIQT